MWLYQVKRIYDVHFWYDMRIYLLDRIRFCQDIREEVVYHDVKYHQLLHV
jgi:hypothetical protein